MSFGRRRSTGPARLRPDYAAVVRWGEFSLVGRILLKRNLRGTKFLDHAFFCNFLLTKGLTQFNMAVDKTGNGKEVGEKSRIISS